MTRRTQTVVGALAAAIALMALPAASQAACYSSTPSSQAIADSPFDGDTGLAPEMAGVGIAVDAACGIAVDPVITNRPLDLISGDGVGIYIDTDGNPATGSPIFDGADRAILTVGLTGPDLPPAIGTWDGTTFSFTAAPQLPRMGEGGARATLDQLGIAAPGNIGVRVLTTWTGTFNTYGDFAPEPLAAPFSMPVSFSTQAPPPAAPAPAAVPAPTAAPVVPAAPTPTPTPTPVGASAKKSCRVPAVKGLTATRAKKKLATAGCRVTLRVVSSKVREGRVVSTSPKAGSKTSKSIVVTVSRGRHAHRAAARSARVDAGALYAAANRRLAAAAVAAAH